MEELSKYLYASITDIQSTIRSIDTKISALLLILIFPLNNISKIANHVENFCSNLPWIVELPVIFLFAMSWVLSFFIGIIGLSAIDNPSKHIKKQTSFKGTYYSGNLYKMSPLDALYNRRDLKSSIEFNEHYSNFPARQQDIIRELVFEQMKLIYIRDVKLYRLKTIIRGIFAWLIAGTIIYICSRFFAN
jgi:hypothetical protein